VLTVTVPPSVSVPPRVVAGKLMGIDDGAAKGPAAFGVGGSLTAVTVTDFESTLLGSVPSLTWNEITRVVVSGFSDVVLKRTSRSIV
jgi:hypothetical protein